MLTAGGSALLIGYGNPGRGDDGLGPAFARRIAARDLPGMTVDIDYQLTVEHTLTIARAGVVIFADAAMDEAAPFHFRAVPETTARTMGSHSVTPEVALTLSRLLFGVRPSGYVLGISGSVFGMMAEGLSGIALRNLDLAEAHFLRWYAGDQLAPDAVPGVALRA